jgi:hypothetical protein
MSEEGTMANGGNGAYPHAGAVRIYRNARPTGYPEDAKATPAAFAVTTTATDAVAFLDAAGEALTLALAHTRGDELFTVSGVLPKLCMLWAKLMGYKAPEVYEERLLIAGVPDPAAHMTLLSTDISTELRAVLAEPPEGAP